MEKLTPAEFRMEYHKRVIAFHILGMNKRTAQRAAMHYFDNSRYKLATAVSEALMENPDLISVFFKKFPITRGRLAQITNALLHESLPEYRSFGLKPKMCRELPSDLLSVIK